MPRSPIRTKPSVRVPDCPYPVIDDSPLGAVVRALAGTDLPVLFHGPAGGGRRWLARTLHGLRSPGRPVVEIDFERSLRAARDDALLVRDALGGRGRPVLIVGALERMTPAGQSALAEVLDAGGSGVLAFASPLADLSLPITRSLIDSFFDVPVVPLARRPELGAIVRAYLEQLPMAGAEPGRSGQMEPHVIDLLASAGWPDHLDEVRRFAIAATTRGDMGLAAAAELQARVGVLPPHRLQEWMRRVSGPMPNGAEV